MDRDGQSRASCARPRARHRAARRHRLHRRAHRGVPRRARARPACAGRWPAATAASSRRSATGWPTIDPALGRPRADRGRRPTDAASLARIVARTQGRDHHGRALPPATASRWSPPAPRPAPTTSTSPASRSSSTGCTSPTTRPPSTPAPGSCTPAASTRSRTTSAPTSPSSSWPPTGRSRCAAWSAPAAWPPAAPSTRRWARSRGPGRCGQAHAARRAVEPRPEGRSSRAVAGKPHRDKVLGFWLLPLPTIDPTVVAPQRRRAPGVRPASSATPTTPAPRRCATPPAVRSAPAALGLAAQVPPLRNFLLGRIKQGDGPDESAPRQVVVHRRLRRRGRRPDRAHPGLRRRPRLRRDREDARRVGALPGLRRQPADRRPGDHRRRRWATT